MRGGAAKQVLPRHCPCSDVVCQSAGVVSMGCEDVSYFNGNENQKYLIEYQMRKLFDAAFPGSSSGHRSPSLVKSNLQHGSHACRIDCFQLNRSWLAKGAKWFSVNVSGLGLLGGHALVTPPWAEKKPWP